MHNGFGHLAAEYPGPICLDSDGFITLAGLANDYTIVSAGYYPGGGLDISFAGGGTTRAELALASTICHIRRMMHASQGQEPHHDFMLD